MPRCERCGADHARAAPCPLRPTTDSRRRRSSSRRLPAPRGDSGPALETIIAGRYRIVRLVREAPGMELYAAAEGPRATPTWIRLYGRATSGRAAEVFLAAAAAMADLKPAGIASILDCGVDPARGLFVVEDLGSGRDLLTAGFGVDRLPVLEVATAMWKVAAALAALHRLRVVHGAVRPDAIVFVGPEGSVPLLADVMARHAQRATMAASPSSPYAAPERGPMLLPGPAEDVFGCAATLFHLVASRAPGPEAGRVPLSELCPDVPMPSVLEGAVRRALAPEPAARPSMAELAEAFGRAIQDLTGPPGGETRPTELGRYALVRRLARGGMGEVFLARADSGSAPARARVFVVKRIRGEYAADDERVARFVSEARLAARMKHPNIVSVYDLGRTGDDLFIVMEYVSGKDLRELIGRAVDGDFKVPLEVALYITHELCQGLAYVHGFVVPGLAPGGLVHRDVSPQNVLLGYDGTVKLIDFGLARGGLGQPRTAAGIVVGKLCYLSPEQARAQVATPRSDLYAAGLTMWELLCGRPMLGAETPEEVAAAVMDPHPVPPSWVRRDVPQEVDRIALHALQPDAAARYADAQSFARDLRRALGTDPAAIAREAGAFLGQLFAAERAQEERMVRAASEQAATQPRAVAPPLEAGGPSLMHDSHTWLVADTGRALRTFDWEVLAESLPGPAEELRGEELPGEELPGEDTALTVMPPDSMFGQPPDGSSGPPDRSSGQPPDGASWPPDGSSWPPDRSSGQPPDGLSGLPLDATSEDTVPRLLPQRAWVWTALLLVIGTVLLVLLAGLLFGRP